jgi:hypothetical protein
MHVGAGGGWVEVCAVVLSSHKHYGVPQHHTPGEGCLMVVKVGPVEAVG